MKLISFLLLVTSCTALAATEEQFNKTFKVGSGGTLVVDVDFGTNAGSEVTLEVWRNITRGTKAKEEAYLSANPVKFFQEGNNITVRFHHKETLGWFGHWRDRNEAKYTVHVPAQFNARLNSSGGAIAASDLKGEVKADTSGGGLRFTRVQGPISGDTSGGGIHVIDCEGVIKVNTSGGGIEVLGGSGTVEAGTSGGGITVKAFEGPASVDTSGGGITIENVGGKVKGETSGGPINVVLPSPVPGDVTLSTSGGGITVRVPETAGFNLNAETTGGRVSCELPVTVQGKIESDHLIGVVNGAGPTLKLETSGGGIHVKKL